MNEESVRSGDDVERRHATLGDVLYADGKTSGEPEGNWVALVRAVGAGDQRALQMLYDRAHRIVYTLSFRITRNREAAEEVTLDVFHDVWRRAAAYDRTRSTVVGWIMNLTRSRAIHRLRFDHRQRRVAREAPLPPAGSPEQDPLQQVVALDQGRLLRDALTQLTVSERQAIEVAYFSGHSYAEVATLLHQPLGTVKSRIRSGLEKLRLALGGRGGDT